MRKLIFLLMLLPILAYSQTKHNVDKIIAKIDNYYILKSEVETLGARAAQEGQKLEKCQAFESLVVQKLLVAKAEIDSVIVEEDQINSQLDARMSEMVRLYGSEKNIVQQFSKSIETLKSELKNQVKEQLTADKMRNTITEKVNVTPLEVKQFFNKIPSDSLPIIPTEVSLQQLVIFAKVTKGQKEDLVLRLNDYKRRIENGEDFATLAKEYSEDQGSKVQGGDLGWAKRGQMVPEFEAAAMSLDSNKLSNIVESDFGFHLIQTLEKRGQEYHARHILLRPDYSRLDLTEPKKFLDSLKNQIEIDSLKFDKAVKLYSEDKMTSEAGGVLLSDETGSNMLPLDVSMEPNLYFTVDPMKVGTISAPLNYRSQDGKTGVRLIKIKTRKEAHKANLKDDYEKLKSFTLNMKQNEIIEKWFKDALAEVFISIDPEYQNCRIFEQ
ncbi:MAG: peptidylprolyl isomerase [Cytophagaceae bacterium]|nr:peptidylprolyl isomerase [Cytophagaceae bacterium]MBL0303641.1 peptidylprolyl isomerase [Cytophagaceae bacterium]